MKKNTKICILGWYGTETIGDRAILAGIIKVCIEQFASVEFLVGSLYPFFTHKTILEDMEFYKEITSKNRIKVNIFNAKNKNELKKNIDNCDIVIMGGGPIMNISPLNMVLYGFLYAKKKSKKTMLFGVGIGPLYDLKYKEIAMKLINNSDIVIVRDNLSKINIENMFTNNNLRLNKEIFVSLDPSVIALKAYMKNKQDFNFQNDIIINLRDFPVEYLKTNSFEKKNQIDLILNAFIKGLSKKYAYNNIKLIPMHYFCIGHDDREFLSKIILSNKLRNVIVQNKPLNLKETMDIFANAKFVIGMRFHSIVFQSLLNGNNYILDYTDPEYGKIIGFLDMIDEDGFYKDRYVNLQQTNNNISFNFNNTNKFEIKKLNIDNKILIYNKIKELN